jgi:Uma2 family endonuclease
MSDPAEVLAIPELVYSYNEYARIEERVEVINGAVYLMSAPTSRHQIMVSGIVRQFENQLFGKRCTPFVSPVDVVLFQDKKETKKPTIVQPDVLIVCDPEQIDLDGYISGAPDFVLEVLSPTSRSHDMVMKLQLYAQAGVKEY